LAFNIRYVDGPVFFATLSGPPVIADTPDSVVSYCEIKKKLSTALLDWPLVRGCVKIESTKYLVFISGTKQK